MTGKREFFRDHKFTWVDNLVFFGLSTLVGLPVFFALIWLMSQVIGVAAPADTVWMLVILTLLLSACAGMSVSITLIRRMARTRSRPK